MSSLTRSIGAAAVFETAAETPPTRLLIISLCMLGYLAVEQKLVYSGDGSNCVGHDKDVKGILKKSTTKP